MFTHLNKMHPAKKKDKHICSLQGRCLLSHPSPPVTLVTIIEALQTSAL